MFLKIDIIQDAYSEMRISGLTVSPSPEDVAVALNRLENMMAEFSSKSLCTHYNFEDDPDPNSATNVERRYNHMMATNLAVRLIPDFNKVVPQSLFNQASQSYSNMLGYVMAENARQIPYPRRMARGSGNTLRFNRWQRFQRPEKLPPNECATNRIIVGGINDYRESFKAYLNIDEVISSFTIEADGGLAVQSSSNNSPFIDYRIKADSVASDGIWQQIKIVATTDSGRVEPRFINFEVSDARVGNTVN